ncbi:MAG: MBL fold metallo-hydrolase [Muribaculaceae bacterium]|nr:MBL fold metallo-hydrolase [Muribaculaceae bacterium]
MEKHLKIAIFQLSLFGINTYIVFDPIKHEGVIIDPGISNPREEKALIDFINRENLKITNIINTHLHIDHAIGDSIVAEKFEAPVLAHEDDLPLGKGIVQQAQMFGLTTNPQTPEITSFINDGDIIKVGDGELKVLHVPGHSPGSIVLYDESDHFLIAGDVLFKGSIGRTDLQGGNHSALISGIKTKLMPLPDNTIVYPGHGEPTTIGEEKLYNPFLR